MLQAEVLDAFSRALRREAQRLIRRPRLTWQQLHNRLQWDAAAAPLVAAERADREAGEPWLRTRTPFRESEGAIRAFECPAAVSACAFSPDGTVVAAASGPAVNLWNAETGSLVAEFQCPADNVTALAFHPAGDRLATGDTEGALLIWDVLGGEGPRRLRVHEDPIKGCAFSPDGSRLVSASGRRFLLWNAESGEVLLDRGGPDRPNGPCLFSPDGRSLLSVGSGSLGLWTATGEEELGRFEGHPGFAFSPDGALLAACNEDKTVRIWELESGELRLTLEGDAFVRDCDFSPDGECVVGASWDGTLPLWSAVTGELVGRLDRHARAVDACTFSPDGSLITSGGEDRTLRLWAASAAADPASLPEGHQLKVSACAFDGDGSRLVSGGLDGRLRIWDAEEGHVLSSLSHGEEVVACEFSPDRSVVVSAGGWMLRFWDAARERELHAHRSEAGVFADCAFSPDGSFIVSLPDSAVRDPETGSGVGGFGKHHHSVTACAFDRSGELIAFSGLGTLEVWDASSRVELRVLLDVDWVTEENQLNACAFGADSAWLVTAGADETLQIWSVQGAEEPSVLEAHAGPVNDCAVNDDGRLIASVGDDRALRIWDAGKREELAMLPLLGEGYCVAFHPSLDRAACGDRTGAVYLIDLVGFPR